MKWWSCEDSLAAAFAISGVLGDVLANVIAVLVSESVSGSALRSPVVVARWSVSSEPASIGSRCEIVSFLSSGWAPKKVTYRRRRRPSQTWCRMCEEIDGGRCLCWYEL